MCHSGSKATQQPRIPTGSESSIFLLRVAADRSTRGGKAVNSLRWRGSCADGRFLYLTSSQWHPLWDSLQLISTSPSDFAKLSSGQLWRVRKFERFESTFASERIHRGQFAALCWLGCLPAIESVSSQATPNDISLAGFTRKTFCNYFISGDLSQTISHYLMSFTTFIHHHLT